MTDPIRPTDDDARALARSLIDTARHAALGVLEPDTGAPMVSRIAVVPGPDGLPISLMSDLSHHTKALQNNPACSILLGEPGAKGDPLTHPRITLQAQARFIRHGETGHADLATHFLSKQPKARLYIGFDDFALVTFTIRQAFLNGGFGKAFVLSPKDLCPR